MAAVGQRDVFSSAITFAGGLALGIGGAYAISRSAFKPANAPTKSTRSKADKAFGNVQGAVDGVKDAVKEAVTETNEKPPASEQLDASDAKGSGPIAPAPVKGTGAALPARHKRAVAGGAYPELSGQQKARSSRLKAYFDAPAPAHGDELLNATAAPAPVWLTGLTNSTGARDSTAQGAIEGIAYSGSDAMFVYESATNAGFGQWAEREAAEANTKGWIEGRPKVVSMQTRTGAGTAIAGYLSSRGAGSVVGDAASAKTVSALTNASGLLAMSPSIVALPAPAQGRLVLQVSSTSQDVVTGSLDVKNDYASILAAANTLSANEDFAVVLSGSRQEAVDVAFAATHANQHVAHVFDGAFVGREIAKLNVPAATKSSAGQTDIVAALQAKKLGHFSYSGSRAPKTVLVVPNGSHATAARTMLALLPDAVRSTVGVIAARIIRPWSDEELVKAIPSSVKSVFVLDETRVSGAVGPLFEDVQASVFANSVGTAAPRVLPVSLPQGQLLQPGQWSALFQTIINAKSAVDAGSDAILHAPAAIGKDIAVLGGADSRIATFFDADANSTAHLPDFLTRTMQGRLDEHFSSSLLQRFDNFQAGGLVRSDVLIGAHPAAQIPVHLAAQPGSATTLVISDPTTTLKHYKVFDSLRKGGVVLVNAPGWDGAEFEARLRAEDKKTLAEKKARVYLIDAAAVVESILESIAIARGGNSKINDNTVPKEVATAVLAVAFYRLHFGLSGAGLVALLEKFLGTAPVGDAGVAGLVAASEKALVLAAYSDESLAASEPLDGEALAAPRPSVFNYNGFRPSADAATVGAEAVPVRSTWAMSAWQLLFSEAYNLNRTALRPDMHEKTWQVTVSENRRLTPHDYDRNVFHMELSTAGTGLKYEVGEALGIHGWNDEDEIREFINWSGYDPDELLAIPSVDDPSRYETRTVFQILQQRLDIFGKPAKSFYDALSKLATDRDEARWLRFVASPEGNATFRKLAEVETVTYAEVLQMFPSARLPLDILLREVAPIEPRHYSIASAQAAVGDSVHLLIVTVDWQTPSGSPRYGQCTRYLANLPIGSKVTVSLKPSIMKLPPNPSQPIIMAGLGTGLAPFRAFIQAREVQKRNGLDVGPMMLYFGSRYRAAEYLYGEELEANRDDGLITRLGLAFSRDGPKGVPKRYIQHVMADDADLVAKYMAPEIEKLVKAGGEVDVVDALTRADPKQQGVFYICGPVDPVFDLTEAVLKSFTDKGVSRESSEKHLENLKEKEAWVLEVY